ncbi:MAG: hypothetical protein K9J16_01180 [Melioribacteraceae bacterium]|nr:hypothetical protein [Melioribacteraceae bacterium]MCF8352877.1 hypothetical protein [Melioribacteraceae bacterium]MCF8393806.1 hypothetical protein [Melioribacteraceae bacterium]MCF8417394.1 hypothetical protein [Melioribacteraceae bacterium]
MSRVFKFTFLVFFLGLIQLNAQLYWHFQTNEEIDRIKDNDVHKYLYVAEINNSTAPDTLRQDTFDESGRLLESTFFSPQYGTMRNVFEYSGDYVSKITEFSFKRFTKKATEYLNTDDPDNLVKKDYALFNYSEDTLTFKKYKLDQDKPKAIHKYVFENDRVEEVLICDPNEKVRTKITPFYSEDLLRQKTYPDESTNNYIYDDNGFLREIVNTNGNTMEKYFYNKNGLLENWEIYSAGKLFYRAKIVAIKY